MKIISLFKRIKNGTVCERIYEIKTQQLSVNYKKQEYWQRQVVHRRWHAIARRHRYDQAVLYYVQF